MSFIPGRSVVSSGVPFTISSGSDSIHSSISKKIEFCSLWCTVDREGKLKYSLRLMNPVRSIATDHLFWLLLALRFCHIWRLRIAWFIISSLYNSTLAQAKPPNGFTGFSLTARVQFVPPWNFLYREGSPCCGVHGKISLVVLVNR